MPATGPSTAGETQSVFSLSYSLDHSHISFRLNPHRTVNDDELKHAVLDEVMKQFHEKQYQSINHERPISHEQDQERFLEFFDIEPETAKNILEEHHRNPEKLRVTYNALYKSLSFVLMATFTHDVHMSWITHAIGMACFERKLTPSELNLLEVGSNARE